MTGKNTLTSSEMERYTRHLALPDFTYQTQQNLKNSHILIVGAGGLGASSLPYLAGAGIGNITIYDHDEISLSNLHRQTIYKSADAGLSKAKIAAAYLQDLNPDIAVEFHEDKLDNTTFKDLPKVDLIIDGSDNFATKSLLNDLSLRSKTPLISASVNQYEGQLGIFAGYADTMPCYHCLFPELPSNARNCNEAGVLGTAAGLTGLYQAHWAIFFLAGVNDLMPGQFLQMNFKSMRNNLLHVPKDKNCKLCSKIKHAPFIHAIQEKAKAMIELVSIHDLEGKDYMIVDVRTLGEIQSDPVHGATHIELTEIPARHEELPKDILLAFVCAGNIRSRQAAEYLSALGYKNVAVLDKFSL